MRANTRHDAEGDEAAAAGAKYAALVIANQVFAHLQRSAIWATCASLCRLSRAWLWSLRCLLERQWQLQPGFDHIGQTMKVEAN
jgi:hypothetical protein